MRYLERSEEMAMIYAVNKRTKEHEVMDPNALYNTAVWEEVHATPDGWIEWQGGECPLPEGVPYETKHESGAIFQGEKPETFGVHWRGYDDAVIAYRPILATKASHPGTMAGPDKCRSDGGEWPAWDGEGLPPVGCECEVRHLHSTDLEWRRIKITSITNDYVVGYIRDDRESAIRRGPLLEFRPIRSEEDRAVDAMWAAYERGDRKGGRPETMREVYRAIRDGKVPGVKLTGGEG